MDFHFLVINLEPLNIKGMPLNSLLQRGGTNLFVSATLSAGDIAAKVRSIDIIRESALILRDELKSTSFGTKNKYCNAYDLKDFWCKGKTKDNTEDFLVILLNLKRIAIDDDDNSNSKGADIENLILDSDDGSEDESYENESCKVTKNIHAYSQFQIMVYTPLHVMTGTQFTPVVVVELLLQAKLEFQSAIMKFEGPVHCFLLIPIKMQERKQFNASHFGTGSQAGFVSGAFDNSASASKMLQRKLLGNLQIIKPQFKSKERPSLDINMPIASVTDDSEYMVQTNKQFIIKTTRCALCHKIQ